MPHPAAIGQGMPWWKYVSNRFLTGVENLSFALDLSEYHTGYRAFSRDVLDAVNFRMNSDGFVFDQEIIAQCVAARFRIAEIAVPVRYFPEASSASFVASCAYGLKILWVVTRPSLPAITLRGHSAPWTSSMTKYGSPSSVVPATAFTGTLADTVSITTMEIMDTAVVLLIIAN